MNIRPKTLRRLLILFGCLAVVMAAGTVVALMYRHNQHAMVGRLRAEGFAAYDAQDYDAAVRKLSEYFTRSHAQATDDEALFRYGRARSIIPLEGLASRHIFEGIDALERYLNIRPDDPDDAKHLLLKLYAQVQYNKEAKTLAAKLLAKNPDDLEALRAQAQAMNNDHDYAAALPVLQKINRSAPLDFVWQFREEQTLVWLKRSPQEVISWAKALTERHPDDPRFELLLARAYGNANDIDNSGKWLTVAASRKPADANGTVELVKSLDQYQMFDKSRQVLQAAASLRDDPQLQRLLVERVWQQGGPDEVIEETKTADAKSAKTDTAVLGYRALSLCQKDRVAEAAPILAALEARQQDLAALAWPTALKARYGPRAVRNAALIGEYKKALDRDPSNGTIWFMLAEAYAAIGETEQAVHAWEQSATASPAWALPCSLMSRTLARTGRYTEAMRAAEAAMQRAPTARLTVTTYALAWYGLANQSAEDPASEDMQKLLQLLSEIQKTWPNDPDTLPSYVTVLARRGQKDKAVQVVKDALSLEPPLPGDTITRLAMVSDMEKLDLDAQIIDRAERAQGLTPELALARALELYQNGKPREAIQLMQTSLQSHPNQVPWSIADARFHDFIGDTSALKEWIELGDGHAGDLQVQYQVLDSPTCQLDRGFWHRTIDRVKTLAGADAQIWRIEDARWHLTGEPTPRELADVIDSLRTVTQASPRLPEPRRLLADALVRSHDLAKAAEELQAVNDLQPGDFDTTSQLVRVLVAQGKTDQAVKVLDAMAQQQPLPSPRRQYIASQLANLGYTDRAIDLLTVDAESTSNPSRDALLAGLYRRAGRADDAAAAYKKILASPGGDPNAIQAGADFFASQHQIETAKKFLDRLAQMPARPGVIELIRAHFAELYESPDEAMKHYTAATQAAPQSQQTWQELSGYHLRHGRFAEADAAAGDGMKSINPAPGLQAMRAQIAKLQSFRNAPELAPLVDVISHDPLYQPAVEMLDVLVAAQAKQPSRAEVAAALRQLADRYIEFLPLQQETVAQYVALRKFAEGQAVAARAAEVFPTSPEPARLLSIVYAESGKWDAARRAALRWREKSLDHPLPADLLIARTYLQQSNPDPELAIRQLEPYVRKSGEIADPQLGATYGQALIMAGRAKQAADLLRPLAQKQQMWRGVWLELATAQKDAPAAAEWINQVVPLIPRDMTIEQLALADAWRRVGVRFADNSAYQQARAVLDPLRAEPGAYNAWELWAVVSQSLDDLPEAEKGYRELLRRKPGIAAVENNLAYVLLLEGGEQNLAEAKKLAADAIAAAPGESTYYDTLARVHMQAGNHDLAVNTFRIALAKDSNNVEAMIGLADSLRSSRAERDEARQLFLQADTLIQSGTPLPAPVRKQFERVKTAVSSSL